MTTRCFYCCLMHSWGNRVTWEISGDVVYLCQYENGADSPKGHHFESCLKAPHKHRQNQKFSGRVRWVIGGRWSLGCEESGRILGCCRKEDETEDSDRENRGNNMLCCRCLLMLSKVCMCLLHRQVVRVSHTENTLLCPKHSVAKCRLPVCPGPESLLIIILLYYFTVLPKKVQGFWWYQCIFTRNCVDIWNVKRR